MDFVEPGLTPQEFDEAIKTHLTNVYHRGWVLESVTKKGRMPVGVVFGIDNTAFLFMGDLLWFPWASDRNKTESIIYFVNKIRRDNVLVFWTPVNDSRKKKYLEYIAKHGIARRVGTLELNEPMAIFQSRKPRDKWQE